MKQGKHQQAEKICSDLIELRKFDYRMLIKRARARSFGNNLEGAINDLSIAQHINPLHLERY